MGGGGGAGIEVIIKTEGLFVFIQEHSPGFHYSSLGQFIMREYCHSKELSGQNSLQGGRYMFYFTYYRHSTKSHLSDCKNYITVDEKKVKNNTLFVVL